MHHLKNNSRGSMPAEQSGWLRSPNVSNCREFPYLKTRCTRGVRVVFSVTRMRSSNSARINKSDFTTEKSCSAHMTMFEIVARRINVVNWKQ